MQVHVGLDLLKVEWNRSVACIGTFDGVHLGHRQVIEATVARSLERGLPSVIITFDRHPASILVPDRCPRPIASLDSNLHQFRKMGISLALVLPFTRQLADTSAEQFFDEAIRTCVRADLVVVGHDFAFGHDRVGTPDWLATRIETEVIPAFEIGGTRISSSAVRRAVAEGHVEVANTLLGRPFAIEGAVVRGAQLGRKLGYPTANVARTFNQITPGDGIYSGEARTQNGRFRAAISIGGRPTIDATSRTIEAYLLDYKGESLYGTSITLEVQRKLRDQIKFEDLESLKEQMAKDVAIVRG